MSVEYTNAEIALLESRLEIMKAHKNGAKIEFTENRVGSSKPAVWSDCPDPRWWWSYYNYRIKPKPIERWVVVNAFGGTEGTYRSAAGAAQFADRYGFRVVHMREVMEE